MSWATFRETRPPSRRSKRGAKARSTRWDNRMAVPMDELRLDRSQFSIAHLDEPDDAKAYWLARSPQERVQGIELCRQLLYGYDPATTRLQRILEITELERS